MLAFDWELNTVMKHKAVHGGNKDKKIADMEEIKPYFKDCPSIMSKINNNIDNQEKITIDDIYAEKCGSKDITTLIQDYVDGKLLIPIPVKKKDKDKEEK
jgi:hypothetical protein